MAIPAGTTKLTISGTLAAQAEKFAFSLWFTGYASAGAVDLPTTIQADGTWTSFRDAVRAMMGPTDSFTQLDSYYYAGGTAAAAHGQAPMVFAGTAPFGIHPTQICVVATLRTALNTRRGRGRIYLPATGVQMTGSYPLMVTSTINPALDALAVMLTARKLDPAVAPVVVSQTGSITSPIISVDGDNIADTQRRRRNKLSAPRHTHAV